MSPPAHVSRAKLHWGIAFATRRKRYTDPVIKLRMRYTNCIVRIPKGMYSRQIEEKLAKKQVGGEWIIEREMTMISKDGNMNGWLIEDEDDPLEHEASDKEVDSDLESTTSSKPKLKKTAKAIPDHASQMALNLRSGPNNNNNNNNNENLDIACHESFVGTTIVLTVFAISTIPTISIIHVVSYLSDNLMKNGLQLLRDNSSNVGVLVVVVVVVVIVRTAL
nr:hypothetical protein [Tanacetum cinerariifolium]